MIPSFSSFVRFAVLSSLFLGLFSELMAQTAETGLATYYADKYHGRSTASGAIYDMNAMTAAHKTLAFGSRVKVTRVDNGKMVFVEINDRGPYTKGRIIDLSRAAAEQLGMIEDGEIQVRIDLIKEGSNKKVSKPAAAPAKEVSRSSTANKRTQQASRPSSQPRTTTAARPPANVPRNVGDLPLRDINGNLINQPAAANLPPSGGVSQPSVDRTTSPAINAEVAKYTPNLYQMMAYKQSSAGFGVQVGAYFSYYRMMEALDELSAKEVQMTLVHNSVKDGKPIFRILVGPFSTRNEANAAKKDLGKRKVKGIVVELAGLK